MQGQTSGAQKRTNSGNQSELVDAHLAIWAYALPANDTLVNKARTVRIRALFGGCRARLAQKYGSIPGPQGIGELLIGEFRPDGKFYFIKRLIAGLNKFNRREIYDSVQDLKTKTCPFVNLPEKASEHQHAVTSGVMAECIWTKPEQPCEVEFIERTPRRRLRHAEFRRLLSDSGADCFELQGAPFQYRGRKLWILGNALGTIGASPG